MKKRFTRIKFDIKNGGIALLDQDISTIIHIVKEKAGITGAINLQAKLDDLGISSIMFIDILIMIENQFGIEFGDEDVNFKKFETLADFLSYVNAKMK